MTMMRIMTGALFGASASAALAADGTDTLNQSVWLRVGAFHPAISSNAQIDHPQTGVAGTAIEFERDLGLGKKKTLPTLLLGARFAGAWRAEFEYFHLGRTGVETLGQLLNVDDSIFPVSAAVTTSFKSTVYRAGVGYSFVKTPQAELGLVLGAHVTKFDISIEGVVSAAGAPLVTQAEVQKKTVPLPTLGLYGAYALAPGWATTGRVDVFKLKRGQYDGRLVNAQLNLIYRVTSNVGLGIGYRLDDYKLTSTRDDFRGRVDYKFSGPQAFLEASF